MSHNVTNEQLASQVAELASDVDALDRGVIDAGLTASRALARAEALEAVLRAAGLERDDDEDATETLADVVAAGIEGRRRKAEARRRRIAASGLTLIAGGRP